MSQVDILSPHYDDAVLSCWHQLEQPDTRVVTVFGGVPQDNKRGAWDGLSSHISGIDTIHLRRIENSDALQSTIATTLDLDFLDRQYAPFKKRNVAEITDTVERQLTGEHRVIATLGIGTYLRRHPDHVTTRKAAVELSELGHDVSFYADIPYMLPVRNFNNWPERISSEKIKRTLNRSVTIESHELNPEQLLRKQIAVKAFASQFQMVNRLAFGALEKANVYRWEAVVRLD